MATTSNNTQTVTVQAAAKELEEALKLRAHDQQNILFEGPRIILPAHYRNNPLAAVKDIEEYYDHLEDDVESRFTVIGHPSDTLNAFTKGIESTFGTITGSSHTVNTLIGPMKIPGQSRSIQIGYDETLTVPYGNIKVPGLPVSLNVNVKDNHSNPMESMLLVQANFKAIYQPLVDDIETNTRKWLTEKPIFLHKSIDSAYKFLDFSGFDPESIIYSRNEQKDLDALVYALIRDQSGWEEEGLRFRRTILLTGEYGVGKTAAAAIIAQMCQKYGKTFIMVRPGDDIVMAFNAAMIYPSCVVFFEDVDQELSGARDERVNAILNTIDGVLSKDAEVMTILTTNHPDRIQKPMMRSGRIDSVIKLGSVDDRVMGGIVDYHCKKTDDSINIEDLLRVADGFPPAFLVEMCKRAKLYVGRGGIIKQEDLVDAIKSLYSQYKMMRADEVEFTSPIDTTLKTLVKDTVSEVVESQFEEFDFFEAVREN